MQNSSICLTSSLRASTAPRAVNSTFIIIKSTFFNRKSGFLIRKSGFLKTKSGFFHRMLTCSVRNDFHSATSSSPEPSKSMASKSRFIRSLAESENRHSGSDMSTTRLQSDTRAEACSGTSICSLSGLASLLILAMTNSKPPVYYKIILLLA